MDEDLINLREQLVNSKKEAIDMNTSQTATSILKTILELPLTALLITTVVAVPVTAAEEALLELPFKGVVQGNEAFNFKADGSGIIVPGRGEGTALSLGQFTAIWDGDITFSNPDNLHPIERSFTAANGIDKVFAEGFASGTPPVDGFQFVVETLNITGGMGRFDGASGSFDLERGVSDIAPPFTSLPTLGSFSGTISVTALAGDCSADGVVDGADLACVVTLEDRDVLLSALNTLPGDLDGDGEVAFADFLELSNNFGRDSATYSEGNIDLAEGVGFADFLLLSASFGQTTVATSVPEPTGFAMLGVAGLLGDRLRRRRR